MAARVVEDRFVTLDGLRSRYLEQGEGPTLILLHGAAPGTSAEVWEPTIGPLASRGLRVLALDLPGWGLTDMPTDHSAGYRRDHILRFMDALGVSRATLVGHSMAGNLVVQLAFTRPERVERIVVVGTGPLLPPLEGQPSGPPAQDTSVEPTLESIRAEVESNTFDQSRVTPELISRRFELAIGPNFTSAQARQSAAAEASAGTPAWQRLDQLPVPALFLYGKQDRAHTAERAVLARQRYPSLNLHVFDGCKHMLMWDKPSEFVNLTADFVLQGAAVGIR